MVEQMYDAADQMGEGLLVDLDGNFENQGDRRRVVRERVEHTDQSSEANESGDGVSGRS